MAAVGSCLLAAPGFCIVLPEGARLSVRLTAPLSSHHAKAGDPVEAVLAAPVPIGEIAELPAGTAVHGRVVEACGQHGRAELLVRFDRLGAGPDGESPIEARVAEVDNARETVTKDGRIVGLPGLTSPPSKAHALLLLAASEHPVALTLLEAGRVVARMVEHAGIHYGLGAEMTLVTERAAEVRGAVGIEAPRLPEAEALGAFADSLPLFAVGGRAQRREDMTNVLVIGSEDEVGRAFTAAGWARAETSRRATTKAFLALVRRHAYKSAPVSLLEIEGRAPDVVFEKQNNSMAKRHHLRLWRLAGGWDGRPAWLGAATHDVGIVFDRPERTFTHQVDPEIDREREKVTSDLAFTGAVEAVGDIARARAPRSFQSGGASILTDGRITVVDLKPADDPVRSVAEAEALSPPKRGR